MPAIKLQSIENINFIDYEINVSDEEIKKRIDEIAKNQNNFKEKDENEARTLARTNERLKRLGKEPIENLDDVPEVIEELDPFLEEAALITQDYINFGRIAKK